VVLKKPIEKITIVYECFSAHCRFFTSFVVSEEFNIILLMYSVRHGEVVVKALDSRS